MASIRFTAALNRYLACPPREVNGRTVGEALQAVFRTNPQLERYILDDQGRLRQHVAIFIDGHGVKDRRDLGDPLQADSEIYVLPALSGG